MITIRKELMYSVFGLRVVSEYSLPELMVAPDKDSPEDVQIMKADLMPIWLASADRDQTYSMIGGHLFFHVPDIGLFCVQDGKRILVSPEPGANERILRLYLLGSCMGAILIQRGILPLHGSCVVVEGKAYAIVGDKGAGKSTLAATFLSRGYSLLTDDVIAVTFDPVTQKAVVSPAYPQQKLWQESLDHLEMDAGHYNTLYGDISKFAIPINNQFCREQLPLAGIFELAKNDLEAPIVQELIGLERFPLLQYHTYRHQFVPLLDLQQWHFTSLAKLLSATPVYQIRRPIQGFTAHQLVDIILDTTN